MVTVLTALAGCQGAEAEAPSIPTTKEAVELSPVELPADYVPGGVYAPEARARCRALGGRETLDGNGLTVCSLGNRTEALERCADGRFASIHSNATGRRIIYLSSGAFAELPPSAGTTRPCALAEAHLP